MQSVAVIAKVDDSTVYGRLLAWGRTPGVWHALVTWRQRLITDGGSQSEVSVAAWLPAMAIRPQSGQSADVTKIALADDRREWPAPFAWWTGLYVGALPSGPVPLPDGLQVDNRPEWERKRERGEHRERKPRS